MPHGPVQPCRAGHLGCWTSQWVCPTSDVVALPCMNQRSGGACELSQIAPFSSSYGRLTCTKLSWPRLSRELLFLLNLNCFERSSATAKTESYHIDRVAGQRFTRLPSTMFHCCSKCVFADEGSWLPCMTSLPLSSELACYGRA